MRAELKRHPREPRVWVDMLTGAGWCCRHLPLSEFGRWRQSEHAKRVEVIGMTLTGDLAFDPDGVDSSSGEQR